jgi:hypothetical protein
MGVMGVSVDPGRNRLRVTAITFGNAAVSGVCVPAVPITAGGVSAVCAGAGAGAVVSALRSASLWLRLEPSLRINRRPSFRLRLSSLRLSVGFTPRTSLRISFRLRLSSLGLTFSASSRISRSRSRSLSLRLGLSGFGLGLSVHSGLGAGGFDPWRFGGGCRRRLVGSAGIVGVRRTGLDVGFDARHAHHARLSGCGPRV